MKKIIVCGAGIGGMVSAIRLAHLGFQVEIFEKNNYAGGKMGEYYETGFRFDTGPSLITMPYVLEEFFKETGRDIKDYINLVPLDNACKYFWSDGVTFNAYTEQIKFKDEFVSVFGEEEYQGFLNYLEYGKFFFEMSEKNILQSEFRIRNFLTAKGIKNINKFISGKSINDLSNKFFKDPKLKQLFDRYATYNGSSPYLASQIFSIIPYIEFKYGAWYSEGGMYRIAKALVRICGEYNIKINYGHELTDITSASGKINKCIFTIHDEAQKSVSEFDIMISNFTNNIKLTGKEYFKTGDWSSSGFIALIGFNEVSDILSQHNILFSEDYEKEFIDIFEKKIPADDMTVYISVTGKSESNDAPAGAENWFVLVNTPALSDNFSWTDKHKYEYFEKVIDKINSFGIFSGDIREKILFSKIFTPADFLKNYGSEFGSIYGLSSNSLFTMFRRPKNKSDNYSNLYFTGGNTHPGGGVPLCFLSGKIVSEIIRDGNKNSY
ncbi:MAG: phytoene desaturase [Ignavibacteria bacterium]|nr:phytoene desaturase [Ignavibacteria bacterium]